MKIDKALDDYNKANPIARWIRSHTPEGYFNRPILWMGLLWILAVATLWSVYYSEPYIECTDLDGCIHPVTGELIPRGYVEGTPLSEQLGQVFFWLTLMFWGVLALNHVYYAISRRIR